MSDSDDGYDDYDYEDDFEEEEEEITTNAPEPALPIVDVVAAERERNVDH